MANRKTKGDSYKIINYDFKTVFPLAGRDPSNMTIYRQKKKFDKEGFFTLNLYRLLKKLF